MLELEWWIGIPGLVMLFMFSLLNIGWTIATVKIFLKANARRRKWLQMDKKLQSTKKTN